ncbi:MAG: hypothetical protein AAGL10_13230 [Pseudomonadota bacterium]
MMDEPPIEPPIVGQSVLLELTADEVEPHLPSETLDDGTVVIDLKPLAPTPEECLDRQPDPFIPEIVVCAKTELSQRLGPVFGPSDEEQFGSAIPRARLKLSEDAEAEANLINKGVGGWNANGGEVRLKIDL